MKQNIRKQILSVLFALLFCVVPCLPVFAADGVSIKTYDDAPALHELMKSMNDAHKDEEMYYVSVESYYGKDAWSEDDYEEYTIENYALKARFGSDTDDSDIDIFRTRWKNINSKWLFSNGLGSSETGGYYSATVPNIRDSVVESAGWSVVKHQIDVCIDMDTYMNKYYSGDTMYDDWGEHVALLMADGYEKTFVGEFEAYVRPMEEEPYKCEENGNPASGTLCYEIVLLPPEYGVNTVVMKLEANSLVTIGDGGYIWQEYITQADRDAWYATSKNLWETTTFPALQQAVIDCTTKADLHFERARVYSGNLAVAPNSDKNNTAAEKEPTIINHKKDADENTGETRTTVPVAVVLVVGGTAAAAVAAAVAGNSSNADAYDDNKRKKFAMYIDKDFGNSIRRGASPVQLRARMVEIDENGVEIDRPDLTSAITVAGSADINAVSTGIAGRYMTANVSAGDGAADKGEVTFRFTGEGGVFHNTIVFRLVGKPRVVFPQKPSYSSQMVVETVAGDNGRYKLKFFFEDAAEEPEKITFGQYADYEIALEPADTMYTYYAVIKNKTAPMDNSVIYEKMLETLCGFTAKFKNGDEVDETFTICTYPEGLSVTAKTQDGKLLVKSYEKEYTGDLDDSFQASEFVLTVARYNENGAIIKYPNDGEVTFDKLGGDESSKAMAEKYQYRLSYITDGKYSFTPQTMLYEADGISAFDVVLKASYNGEGGLNVVIPLHLACKKPDPMLERKEEYEKLISRINRFASDEEREKMLEEARRICIDNEASVCTMRVMSKSLIRGYMRYWAGQSKKQMCIAEIVDWAAWGAEWTKFIGDCAFSYLAVAYAGPVAEALISPAKDVMANALGEVGVSIFFGTKFKVENLEISKALKNAGDNVAANMTLGVAVDNPLQWRKNMALIGGYFSYSVILNYSKQLADKGEKADFLTAIYDAFSDLTVNSVKAAAGALFKNWLNSEAFKNKIGPYLSEYVGKQLGKDAKLDKLSIVEKYLTDWLGQEYGKVCEGFMDETYTFTTNSNGAVCFDMPISFPFVEGKYVLSLNLSWLLCNITNPLFGILYNAVFGDVPVAIEKVDKPTDPPIPDNK